MADDNSEIDKVVADYIHNGSNYHILGNALRNCSPSVLKASIEAIIQTLSSDIKECTLPNQLALTIGCIEVILHRIQNGDISFPLSLNRIPGIMFYHSSSSTSCQCIVLHCLALVASINPAVFKEYHSSLVQWSIKALYSGIPSLTKEAAVLYQALHCSKRKDSSDESESFYTILQSLNSCIDILTGTDENAAIGSLLIPNHYMTQTSLTNVLKGLTQLIITYLLVQTCQRLTISLDKLLGIIWKLMNTEVFSQNLHHILLQNAWKILLVAIHSCGMSLMPYSQTIEAAVIKTLKMSAVPNVVIALVCKCALEWMSIRRNCPHQFIENVATDVCIMGHNFIQKCGGRDCEDSIILQHYICTLHRCVQECHALPPTLIKCITSLCHLMKTHPSTVAAARVDTNKLINELLSSLCRQKSYPLELDLTEVDMSSEIVTPTIEQTNSAMPIDVPMHTTSQITTPPTTEQETMSTINMAEKGNIDDEEMDEEDIDAILMSAFDE